MMVEKITPKADAIQLIERHALLHILEGSGGIEVDFKTYHDWEDKLIFLEKGQYVKFLTDDFVVRKIEFPDEILFRSRDVRVLFRDIQK